MPLLGQVTMLAFVLAIIIIGSDIILCVFIQIGEDIGHRRGIGSHRNLGVYIRLRAATSAVCSHVAWWICGYLTQLLLDTCTLPMGDEGSRTHLLCPVRLMSSGFGHGE